MASGFKQQCPSCEAMVPIRDPNLVGRKIDCPTCKYRFVVEKPADDLDADDVAEAKSRKGRPDAAPASGPAGKGAPGKTKPTGRRRDADEDDEDQPRAKSGDGGSTKLVVGLLAGVLGIGLIGLAVFFGIFYDSGSSTPAPSPARTTTAANSPTSTPSSDPSQATPGGATGIQPLGTPSTPDTGATGEQRTMLNPADIYNEITNLLPNDTDGVIHLPLKTLYNSPIGNLVFDKPGGFSSPEFEKRVGIRFDEVERFVQAISFRKNWTYQIVKTTQPIHLEKVQERLQLKEAPGGAKNFFHGPSNDWLDAMFRYKSALNNARLGPLAVYQHNLTTLIFGDDEPVRSFVQASGKFTPQHKGPFLALPNTGLASGTPPEGTPQPAAGSSDIAAPGAGGGVVGIQLRSVAPPTEGTPGEAQPVRPYYATVAPALKAMLDRLEQQPTLVSMAFDTRVSRGRLEKYIPTYFNLAVLGGYTTKQLEQANLLGMAVQTTRNGFALNSLLECTDVGVSRAVRKSLLENGSKLAKLLETVFGVKAIVVNDQTDGDAAGPGSSPDTASPGGNSPRVGAIGGGVGIGGGGATDIGGGGSPGSLGLGVGGGRTGQPEPGSPENSTIEPTRQEKLVVLRVNLVLDNAGHRKLENLIVQHVRQLRGDQEMATGQLRWHDVGRVTVERAQKDGAYPRGTYHREPSSTRAGIPYPPNQRVSWMAALLPHLGYEVQINDKESWNHSDNLPAASLLVPQFLDPRAPRSSWWVRYPGITQDLAATHIVGMAGIGIDAAEYAADDPNTKTKLGVFGYDRVTKLNEIPDGAAHTIMMIQVPQTYKRPWIAGGGATVMGVPDPPLPSQRSVTPFLSTQYNNKPGTMAIMADGSVRFIAADVPDELFKAMCTIQGGDQKFLDRDVPLVKGGETVAVRTEPTRPAPAPESKPIPANAWKEFVSQEGGFSVMLPGDPQKLKQTVKTPAGEIDVQIFNVQKSVTESFGVIYTDYPSSLVQKAGADGLYAAAKQAVALQLPGGKVVKEDRITVAGQPGRALLVDVAGKLQVRLHLVLVNNRMYQVAITGPSGLIASGDAERMFSSFKLLGK